MSDVFANKYRPLFFGEIIGQAPVVKSLQLAIEERAIQCFLFSGPSGTGKTTLARIVAGLLDCADNEVVEVDGATYSGVESTRNLQALAQYSPFGGGSRAIIIDECHRLSGQAWDTLLKATEEPPDWLLWFLCTTNPGKVPATIKSRFAHYQLKPVAEKEIAGLVEEVCKLEQIQLAPGVLDLLVRHAAGSPRQALTSLSTVYGAKDRKEAASLLQVILDSDPIIELCRHLIAGGSWEKTKAILAKLEGESPEAVRIVVSAYFAKAIKTSSEKQAERLFTVLDAFSVAYNAQDGEAPLLLSIGRVLFS